MSWSRLATRKSLGPQTQPSLKNHDIICFHTMVGYLGSTERMFKEGGYKGTESHIGIGGIWGTDYARGLDGKAWQFQDTDHTADANLNGTWHILSIEMADNAPRWPKDILPMTSKQVDTAVEIAAQWCIEFDIPPVMIPDTMPNRRGLAYHYQGVGPNLVRGGEVWSAAGHECPGPQRIQQLKTLVFPRIALRVHELKNPVEDDMKDIVLKNADRLAAANALDKPGSHPSHKLGDVVKADVVNDWGNLREQEILAAIRKANDAIATLSKKFDALHSAVNRIAPIPDVPPKNG